MDCSNGGREKTGEPPLVVERQGFPACDQGWQDEAAYSFPQSSQSGSTEYLIYAEPISALVV